jgi:hypothetical protein
MPLPKNCAPPPCLSLGIKDLLKEDKGFLMKGGFWMGDIWLKGNCWREIAEGGK